MIVLQVKYALLCRLECVSFSLHVYLRTLSLSLSLMRLASRNTCFCVCACIKNCRRCVPCRDLELATHGIDPISRASSLVVIVVARMIF